MENKDIKQLCKRIYKDHKEALDLISEYAKETDFEESAKEFIKGINAKELYVDGKTARFIPQEFENNIEKVGQQNWCKGYPFTFWFMAQDEKLGLIIEVGPFDSAPLRQQFLEHLKKHGFTIHDYSFKPEARYTRIFTKYPKFEDWDNKHQIIQKMDNLYTSSSKKAEANLLEACKTFNWGSE
jgi:hypothetical protein